MTKINSTISSSIGPHEGHELDLMLKGKKPMAMFCDDYMPPIQAFRPYVIKGVFSHKTLKISEEVEFTKHYFALPEEVWRIDEMIKIDENRYTIYHPDYIKTEQRIGKLLGYSDKDIKIYIQMLNKKPTTE